MLDDNDRVRCLGDDNQPAGAAILLGQHGNLLDNLSNISDAKTTHLSNKQYQNIEYKN